MPEGFFATFRVSWVDTDAAGIVHFSNFFRFFERTEELFYNEINLNYAQLISEYNIKFPRIEAYCRFASPCKFNDVLEVTMRITEIKEKTIRTEFKIKNATSGKLAAEGGVVNIASSPEVDRSLSLPVEFANRLKKYFGYV